MSLPHAGSASQQLCMLLLLLPLLLLPALEGGTYAFCRTCPGSLHFGLIPCQALKGTQAPILRATEGLQAVVPHKVWSRELLVQVLGESPAIEIWLHAILSKFGT